jgi:uncharacterized protein (DUF1778 family)
MDPNAIVQRQQDRDVLTVYSHREYNQGMAEKADRIQLRISEWDKKLLSEAAAEKGVSLSEFIVSTSVTEAKMQLADRTHFVLNEEEWETFERFLNAPPKRNEGLARLLARERPTI